MPRHPLDVFLGQKLRQARTAAGLSQSALGKAHGITFQQIQKYEGGANRVSFSRLVMMSRTLGVEPAWFFEDLPADGSMPGPASRKEQDERLAAAKFGRRFSRLRTTKGQALAIKLVDSLAALEHEVLNDGNPFGESDNDQGDHQGRAED